MARYPHYITECKGGRWPSLVICVDSITTAESVGGHPGRQREVLNRWEAIALAYSKDRYIDLGVRCGAKDYMWWQVLSGMAKTYNYVLILSYQCGRQWSLLDLWGELEHGRLSVCPDAQSVTRKQRAEMRRLRLSRSDPLAPLPASAVSRMLESSSGTLVCEDPPNIAQFRLASGGGNILWIDVRNHGVELQQTLGAGFHRSKAIAEWFTAYCGILHGCNLGAIRATAGQQAIKGWRHSYYRGGVHVHNHKAGLEIEGASYHGGRCECFRLGSIPGTVYHVDIRSMYPAICSAVRLPARLLHIDECYNGEPQRKSSFDAGSIAEVTICTDEPAYPFRRGGLTVWPVGTFRTVLAGPEVYDAELRERIVRWHRIAYYDMEPCLKEYADALYQSRCQAELASLPTVADSIKKLLVCLPGKFAQRLRCWANAPTVVPVVHWGEWYALDRKGELRRYRSLGGIVQQDRDMGWGGEAVPAIAAWITSAGRMLLLNTIRIAGWDQVYYCDTDSLLLTEVGYERLRDAGQVVEGRLGYWQSKGASNQTVIHGIKHYRFAGRLVCAGMPRGSSQPDDSGTHFWYTDAPGWAVSSGAKPDAVRRLMAYNRSGPYQHGVVGPGGRVLPFRLGEQ